MTRPTPLRVLRPLVTLAAVLGAALVLWQLYLYYTYAPQTRDGKLRADVVPLATDVSGKVEAVYVHDNQVVQKGERLLSLDKERLRNALAQAEAAVERSRVQLASAQRERKRYLELKTAVSAQQKDYRQDALAQANAELHQALADRELATLNLQRADLYAPVDGVVTNFSLRPGAYASAGQPVMTLVDSSSFYVAGYFEETKLAQISEQSEAAGEQFAAITTATSEQSSTANVLSSNLQSIAQANGEQREVVANLADTARELDRLAAQLRQEVERFR